MESHFVGTDPCIGCLYFGSQIWAEDLFDIRPNSLNPKTKIKVWAWNPIILLTATKKGRCLKRLKDLPKEIQNEKREKLWKQPFPKEQKKAEN